MVRLAYDLEKNIMKIEKFLDGYIAYHKNFKFYGTTRMQALNAALYLHLKRIELLHL